jgi:hypothetical protein
LSHLKEQELSRPLSFEMSDNASRSEGKPELGFGRHGAGAGAGAKATASAGIDILADIDSGDSGFGSAGFLPSSGANRAKVPSHLFHVCLGLRVLTRSRLHRPVDVAAAAGTAEEKES